MNRREFINRGAALLAAGSIASGHAFAAAARPNKSRIGIQLYSVKDELPKDFKGTLQKLSNTGYSAVELYGFNGEKFFDYTTKELRKMVKDMGMTISGTHANSRILSDDINAKEWDFWRKVAAQIEEGGGKWAIQAGFPGAKTINDLKRIAAYFNRAGEVCKKEGVKFAFHNHHTEFRKIDNEIILDFLIANTDPKLVSFQLDMGHAINAGSDCVRYIRNYPKRFPLWHASDFDAASRKYTNVGHGSVPYAELFKLSKSAGLEQLTVEQETQGDIFASCQVDFDYLKTFKW
jgi:sugar phosphate isomerase/epimerase